MPRYGKRKWAKGFIGTSSEYKPNSLCFGKWCPNYCLPNDAFCESCRCRIDQYENIYGKVYVTRTRKGYFIK